MTGIVVGALLAGDAVGMVALAIVVVRGRRELRELLAIAEELQAQRTASSARPTAFDHAPSPPT